MKKASDYTLTKSDGKTKVPLLAYFVSKIIEYNTTKRRSSTTTTPPIFKKKLFFCDWDYYEKIQKQIHRYQKKNKSMLIDHLISGASRMFSEDAENHAPDLFRGLFSKDPTTDEDKPKLADDLDQVYTSLYEKQQAEVEAESGAETAEETPMEEESTNDDDDDDGKDERNPRPQSSPEVQQATTMEQLLSEQSQHDSQEEQDSQEQELVFNTPIPQQAQQKYNQKTAAQAKGKKKLPSKK